MLEILGKDPDAPGIIEAAECRGRYRRWRPPGPEAPQPPGRDRGSGRPRRAEPRFDGITLRQRGQPLIDMLRRSGAAGEVVWGV
ncbi:DUF1840 family protein [Candidatus Skiveiella danica]|uniref:DUF1840 family protein n=1 Tax=Candidatus Skiveiella danica TaxID=3386177 RepID=UPI0039B90436